ncbi:hypothetical protein Bpfe_027392 [Biomphalaria pfeifferi]|uniref:Uncharacterized protein n=1 Tax=Biomphalaria pfeifferi TaxID=112525 RepID=A0AAD8AVH0_BIOPF|nr:hypothetical protein Bpfe_027392 [Biomphalaria pfeifferi]
MCRDETPYLTSNDQIIFVNNHTCRRPVSPHTATAAYAPTDATVVHASEWRRGRDKYDCHRSSARKRIRTNRGRRRKKKMEVVFCVSKATIMEERRVTGQVWGTQYTIALLDKVRTTDWGSSDLYTPKCFQVVS